MKNTLQIKKGTIVQRDPNALVAKMRSGAGRHTDRKKAANKKACRQPVRT